MEFIAIFHEEGCGRSEGTTSYRHYLMIVCTHCLTQFSILKIVRCDGKSDSSNGAWYSIVITSTGCFVFRYFITYIRVYVCSSSKCH